MDREQESYQHGQAAKALQPAYFQYRIVVTHNLAHLDPRLRALDYYSDEASLYFEPLLQSGNRHFELACFDDGFVIGGDEREIIRPQPER